MRIETWISNKGDEEIHHFVEGAANLYLFGFNKKLLGESAYSKVLEIVEDRIAYLMEHNE